MKKKLGKFSKRVLWTPRWSTDSMIGGSNFFAIKAGFSKWLRLFQKLSLLFAHIH